MERIELCANKCCPTIAHVGDVWFVDDDYGGEVKLTTQQLDKLIEIRSEYQKVSTSKRIAESEKAIKDGLYIQS